MLFFIFTTAVRRPFDRHSVWNKHHSRPLISIVYLLVLPDTTHGFPHRSPPRLQCTRARPYDARHGRWRHAVTRPRLWGETNITSIRMASDAFDTGPPLRISDIPVFAWDLAVCTHIIQNYGISHVTVTQLVLDYKKRLYTVRYY